MPLYACESMCMSHQGLLHHGLYLKDIAADTAILLLAWQGPLPTAAAIVILSHRL